MSNKIDKNNIIDYEESKSGEIHTIDIQTITKEPFKLKKKYKLIIIISAILLILFIFIFIFIYKSLNKHYLNEFNKDNQTNGNVGLNPYYKKVNPKDERYIYIPIVGTDDIHGNFFPRINNLNIGDSKYITYKTGGLEYIAKYINILRDEFGTNRVLYFDSGDMYQGGIDSVLFNGEIILEYFNLIGLNGSTIGNHEFDYSRKWIENKIKNSNHKTLINNIMDKSNNKTSGALGQNHETSHLYEIKLENNDTIKIGVIGLTFNMNNDKTIPDPSGNKHTWDNITFFSYMHRLEEESNKLRNNGACAIIGLTHFGIVCNQTESMKLSMYNRTSIQSKCDRNDEDSVLYKLLDVLKPGILDAIIAGDTHMETHHWENNIPIMSTINHARFLNILYLPFKKSKKGKYILKNDEIKIEGPLPACEKIFKNFQNCELISSKEYPHAGELINFSWHGKKIEKDPIIQPIYDKYYKKYKEYAEESIVTFVGFDKIKVDKSGDSILGNTYIDAISDITNADFAIINKGLFPEELIPGTLTRVDFFNQMPYLDRICTVNITGIELKRIINTVQVLGKYFYHTSKLKQTIKIDRSGNKTLTNLEILEVGKYVPIDDNKIYKMASSKYILSDTSGEDFTKGDAFKIINKKYKEKKIKCSNITMDLDISEYFKGKGILDLSNKVDVKSPRIIKIYE